MSEDLYQDLIIEHSRTPLNFGKLGGDCNLARMQNPLCGDEIDLYIRFEDGKIADCRFEGFGCSISKAAASILSEEVKGRSVEEVEHLISAYHALLTDRGKLPACCDTEDGIGDLVVFSGVQNYPTRIKCATLAVEALAVLINKHKMGSIQTMPDK